METQKARKPLTDWQMAKAISIVVVGGAVPLYLAIKGNPWPCAALIAANCVYQQFRRRQLNK